MVCSNDQIFNQEKFSFDKNGTHLDAKFRMNAKIAKEVFLILFIVGGLILFSMNYINHSLIPKFNNDYYSLVENGDFYIDKDISRAKVFFQEALDVHPDSKAANYGLAKCLLLQCKLDTKNCGEAKGYFEYVKSTNKISIKEFRELTALL